MVHTTTLDAVGQGSALRIAECRLPIGTSRSSICNPQSEIHNGEESLAGKARQCYTNHFSWRTQVRVCPTKEAE